MRAQIHHGPGNACAQIELAPGEVVTAEGGSMIAMSADTTITTTTKQKQGGGGLLKAAKRWLAGENFFINHFTGGPSGGEVWLAPTLMGDLMVGELDSETMIVQGGSFVACEPSIEIDMGWQGFKSILSGESMFWLHMKGTGQVIFNSFGAIYPVEVDGEHIVDTGHIVAFQDTLEFTITKAGKSWVSSFLGGEGLVCKFQGKGTVWCQSHNPTSFGSSLGPLLRAR